MRRSLHSLAVLIALSTAMATAPALADDVGVQNESGPPLAPPASQPTTEPSELQIRLQNRQQVRDDFDALPKLPNSSLAKVIKLALDGGHVHVTSPLPPTPASEVALSDWPGRSSIEVGSAGSLAMHFRHEVLLDHDLTVQNTEVYTLPDHLQIVRDTESPTGMHSVTLIQSRRSADEQGNPIRLLVNDSRDGGGESKRMITGESFEKLRQTNDADLRRDLLPILRDLGAADLLQGVSPADAWQVLGGDVKPDDAAVKQIDALLPNLSADEFATRAAAEESLNKLGPVAAAALAQRDRTKLSPDAQAVIDNFLHRTQKLDAASVAQLNQNPLFLLDTIAANYDPRLTRAAMTRLQTQMGKPLDLPENLSADERQKRIDAYRDAIAPPATQP